VLAVGPGAFDKDGNRILMSVKAGDKVLIPQVGFKKAEMVNEARAIANVWCSTAALRSRSAMRRTTLCTGSRRFWPS
jgi:hypothetical protein